MALASFSLAVAVISYWHFVCAVLALLFCVGSLVMELISDIRDPLENDVGVEEDAKLREEMEERCVEDALLCSSVTLVPTILQTGQPPTKLFSLQLSLARCLRLAYGAEWKHGRHKPPFAPIPRFAIYAISDALSPARRLSLLDSLIARGAVLTIKKKECHDVWKIRSCSCI